jgi:hypothetical protein
MEKIGGIGKGVVKVRPSYNFYPQTISHFFSEGERLCHCHCERENALCSYKSCHVAPLFIQTATKGVSGVAGGVSKVGKVATKGVTKGTCSLTVRQIE